MSSKCSVTKEIRSDFNLTSSRGDYRYLQFSGVEEHGSITIGHDIRIACLDIMCFCDKNVPTREVKPSHGVKTEYKGDNYTAFI